MVWAESMAVWVRSPVRIAVNVRVAEPVPPETLRSLKVAIPPEEVFEVVPARVMVPLLVEVTLSAAVTV